MKRPIFLLLLSLLLLSTLTSPSISAHINIVPLTVHQQQLEPESLPDPICARGKRSYLHCCHGGCPKCGGRGCGRGRVHTLCCKKAISRSARSCDDVGPPCKMSALPPKDTADDVSGTVPPPTTAATTTTTTSTTTTMTTTTTTTTEISPSPSESASPPPSATPSSSASPSASVAPIPSPIPSASPSPSARATPPSDPYCTTGVRSGTACCPAACGKCGGQGCSTFGPNDEVCCSSRVNKDMRLCTENMPPCVIVEVTPGPPQTVAVDGGQWEPLVPAKGSLTPRHEACFVMVDGKAYLLGGRGERPVDVFDPATGEWRQREGYGKRLHHMQCVAKDGNIWIASSWTGGFPREENVAEVIVYHTRNDTWGTKAGLPEQRRRGGAAAVLRDGKIYVVGGNRGGHGEHATALGWMDAYDIERDEWEIELPELPEARDHVGGGMVDGRLCVAGGRDSGTRSFFRRVVVSAWCYDYGERVWVRGDDLEVGRAGAATSSVCGELMVAGGETGRDLAWERVDLFDGERWRRAPDLKRGRHGTGLAIGEGRVWIASGSGNRGGRPELESMEQYVRAGCAGP